MKDRLELWALKCLVFIFRLIPFWCIYKLSDLLTWVSFYLLHVRHTIIQKNLRYIFPDLSNKKLKKIEKETLRNFFDVMLESVKSFTMTQAAFHKRFKVNNADIIQDIYKQGRSVILFSGHTGNWEWAATIQFSSKHQACCIYKPLHNKLINQYVIENRCRFGAMLGDRKQIHQILEIQSQIPTLYGIIGDQRPGQHSKKTQVSFFNRQISCFQGCELIAKQYNYPVAFLEIKRIKRGFYTSNITLISDNPRDKNEGEISQQCFSCLEANINDAPESWLWLHSRFKNNLP